MSPRSESASARAELSFHAYYQLGATRSLRRTQTELRAAGISLSLPTLKRYSAAFRWQERIAELDADARRRHREKSVESTTAMHDRHTQLGRAMQGAGGTALQRLLSNDARLAGLTPSDIARLVDLGLRTERSAVGVATDRREITLEVWNDVVVTVVRLFRDVNEEPDPRTRARLFARRLDRLADERLAAANEREG
jgi:hypothetical protein